MMSSDDTAQLRRRLDALVDDLERDPASGCACAPARVVQTYTESSYPAAASRVYAVRVVEISSAETEGATPTLTVTSGGFYAANIGSAIPPSGTNVLATQVGGVGGLWIFRYDG